MLAFPKPRFLSRTARLSGRRSEPLDRPHLLVVGNGMVGWKLCHALASRGLPARWRITIIGDEPHPAYDRIRLSDILAAGAADELLLSPRHWYQENGFNLRTGELATAIDREKRLLTLSSGATLPYDRLVLATGSHPLVPPIPGTDHPLVRVYRTLEDLAGIRALAGAGRQAAVVGGGLLGLEAAKALRDLGVAATVLERGPGLMTRQLTPEASALLEAKVKALGVRVLVSADTRSIDPTPEGGLRIQFGDGTTLDADFVVIAAGIRPRDELARASGLPCNRRGGVEVDDTLTTADPLIQAIGECASHRGIVYGLVAPGYQMAETLADILAGRSTRFTGSTLSARLKLLGVDVCSSGDFQQPGESLIHRTDDTYREIILRNGRLAGALSVGANPEAARCQDAAERQRRISRRQRTRFLHTGRLWPESESADPHLWPSAAIVCSCKGITRGTLADACARGCRSADALAAATGASTVCGSCRPLVAALAGAAAVAPPARGVVALIGASLGAAGIAGLIALLPPLAYGQSVVEARWYEFLFVDGGWRRVTGFFLLGFAVASTVLSLRKRIRRFAVGDFGWWRFVHAALGLGGLVMLVGHTGLRLGDNVNRVLMLDFLGLTVLGAGAGLVTALERRLPPRTALRLRRSWTWAHIVFTWPLPVLVGVHVLNAYYF